MTQQIEAAVRFGPRRLGHVNLFVEDLERSLQFYEGVCGIEEVAREPGIGAGFLSNGNTHHDVGLIEVSEGTAVRGRGGHLQIPADRGKRAGLNHLGWELENEAELVAAYRRAQALALPVHRLVARIMKRNAASFCSIRMACGSSFSSDVLRALPA